ncbi:YncE family protein [Actimicrobium sp. CCI2.3]|uniref:YncE family protein n=1 Tax=Actimicrobium sp. CCI2.3 TaxID=3048616 RepID=UPI002AB4A868|nr:YncE family protein [Actimicrobium sp. CCI2.3]MDY7575115.1 YncE family protein [Actimicrobium sp. CCI2.3]MEB0022544.1 YncE family protein [Actimicrobium sp. CCI2.3]
MDQRKSVHGLVVDKSGQRVLGISDPAMLRIIDPANRKQVASLTLPGAPLGLVIDEEGERAYALTTARVQVIDTTKGKLLKSIPVDPSANALALDPDGRKLYVTSSGSNGGIAGITVVNALAQRLDKVIPTATLAPDLPPNSLCDQSEWRQSTGIWGPQLCQVSALFAI